MPEIKIGKGDVADLQATIENEQDSAIQDLASCSRKASCVKNENVHLLVFQMSLFISFESLFSFELEVELDFSESEDV